MLITLYIFVPVGIGIRAFVKHLRSKAPKWDATIHEWVHLLDIIGFQTDSDAGANRVFALRSDMVAALHALDGEHARMFRKGEKNLSNKT